MKTFPVLAADEAAALINNQSLVGFSGFTPAGAAKAIPAAFAKRARRLHDAGLQMQIGVMTGASTGPSLDGALAEADAVSFRTPYQSDPGLRRQINNGHTRFFDMHLSTVAPALRHGFFGRMQWAVIEASDVTADGEIVPTSSVGNSATFCREADRILIELNERHPQALRGFHDIYEPADQPNRREIPLYSARDRIGVPAIKVDPRKIFGIVKTNLDDETRKFKAPTDVTWAIGENVADFLAAEFAAGRIPKPFLPIQSGVGNIANAVLLSMRMRMDIPTFEMFTEVIQDAAIDLLRAGKISFASGTSLSVSPEVLKLVYENLGFFRDRLVLRPQEISNHPELIRRLGVIAINTALEVDLFGNVNSTHVMGRDMMNGIGGSADFARNAYLSIFTCPSIAKDERISTIVPMASHVDHSEHTVQVLITEQGIADLRGKDPQERARLVIENCAHPSYRDELRGYLETARRGHTPQSLTNAFAMHAQYLRSGDMRGVSWYVDRWA
jgi:acetyl-CoA hydrolase